MMSTQEIQAELQAELELHRQHREEMQAAEHRVLSLVGHRASEYTEGLPPFWRVSELALQFPCLADHDDMPGLYPFDGPKFLRSSLGMSHGQKMAVAFVMSVFNHENPFNVQEALGVWDRHNRAVFVRWASNPWWA